MKWKIDPPPAIQETRVRVVFAWLPVKTDDNYLIWLESYVIHETYKELRHGPTWIVNSRIAIHPTCPDY